MSKKTDEDFIFSFLLGVAAGRMFFQQPKVTKPVTKPGFVSKLPGKPGIIKKPGLISTTAKGFTPYTLVK